MKSYAFVSVDIGASTGRMHFCRLSGEQIEVEEFYRFPTKNATMLGLMQWDTVFIYNELLAGLAECSRRYKSFLDGLAITTWGVDFALLGRDGIMLGNPVHYRDKRTEGVPELTYQIISKRELYNLTGVNFNQFNTIFQLHALSLAKSPLLEVADSFLMMGDLFHYLLSGRQSCEYTNASTTQLINAATGTWHDEIIARLGLPRHLFKEITPAGTILGTLLPAVAKETGLDPSTRIITPATHDTASAFAGAPITDASIPWACISCGTWAIMGTEISKPLITDDSFYLGFSNEAGAEGKTNFYKTFIGMWILQECRRIFSRQGTRVDYDQLTAEAEAAEPFASIIDVDDPRLYAPEDMTQIIREICQETGQHAPDSRGAFVRCALDSMALKCRQTLREMDQVLKRKTQAIHLVGGAVKNKLLCQLIADACGVKVLAGPAETAVLGNAAIQAATVGALDSLAQARQVIGHSSQIQRCDPMPNPIWDKIDMKMANLFDHSLAGSVKE